MNWLGTCWHYIRKEKDSLLGHTEEEFKACLDMLAKDFIILEPKPNAIPPFVEPGQIIWIDRPDIFTGVLLTFDDGLEDHYRAAKILHERGLKAIFFIPTCIFQDNVPPNPNIIHYGIAEYRIKGFIEACEKADGPLGLNLTQSPDAIIKDIKKHFKYSLPPGYSRLILLEVYRELLLKNDPKILEKMCLTESQVKEMIQMGHTIGIHSRTHPHVVRSNFDFEINSPRAFMEEKFKVPVTAFSYPFGHKDRDCLPPALFKEHQDGYKYAFTVEEKVNRAGTDPYDLGRYMPHSTDTPERLKKKLKGIIDETSPVHI